MFTGPEIIKFFEATERVVLGTAEDHGVQQSDVSAQWWFRIDIAPPSIWSEGFHPTEAMVFQTVWSFQAPVPIVTKTRRFTMYNPENGQEGWPSGSLDLVSRPTGHIQNDLGELLRQMRASNDWSGQEAAESIAQFLGHSFSWPELRDLESGAAIPDHRTMAALAMAYDVPSARIENLIDRAETGRSEAIVSSELWVANRVGRQWGVISEHREKRVQRALRYSVDQLLELEGIHNSSAGLYGLTHDPNIVIEGEFHPY